MQLKHGRTKSEYPYGKKYETQNPPREYEYQPQRISEEKFEQEIDSPENVRRSSLGAVSTPITSIECQANQENESNILREQELRESELIEEEKKNNFEDKFMLDSLNEQKKPPDSQYQQPVTFHNPDRNNEIHSEMFNNQEPSFMGALQNAIAHFEFEANNNKKPASKNKQNNSSQNDQKQTTLSSYNSSNTTTANSAGDQKKDTEETITEQELLKKEYNTLLIKYNELKVNNKNLMNDYASLRSQLEELKSVLFNMH